MGLGRLVGRGEKAGSMVKDRRVSEIGLLINVDGSTRTFKVRFVKILIVKR